MNAPAHPTRRAFGEGLLAALVGTGVTAAVLAPDPVWDGQRAAVGEGDPSSPLPHPDAALIAARARYVAAVGAYNARGGHLEPEADPLWHEVEAAEEAAQAMPARTLAGVVAKARAAVVLGTAADGTVRLCDSYAGSWPEAVVRDVLRLGGEQVPA